MIFVLYIAIILVVNVALLAMGLGIGMLAGALTLLASFSILTRINNLVLENERAEILNAVAAPGHQPYLLDPLPPMPRRCGKPKPPKP